MMHLMEHCTRENTSHAKIAVFCDNQSVIHDIGATHKPAAHTRVQQIRNLLWTLHAIARTHMQVQTKWIPGHVVGLARNEETDMLAKAGANASSVNETATHTAVRG